MKITILNGNTNQSDAEYNGYLENLTFELQKTHAVETFHLQNLKIRSCLGCWSCWWKTPGNCVLSDDGAKILRAVIQSDFVLFASPLMAGFVSSTLKKVMERFVIYLHPYFQLRNRECHHVIRYEKNPIFAALVKKEADTDEEDIVIIRDLYERMALNFNTSFKYLKLTDEHSIEQIIHETCLN